MTDVLKCQVWNLCLQDLRFSRFCPTCPDRGSRDRLSDSLNRCGEPRGSGGETVLLLLYGLSIIKSQDTTRPQFIFAAGWLDESGPGGDEIITVARLDSL